MLEHLLTAEVQNFIQNHEGSDEHSLLFKYKSIHGLSASIVVDQIIGRRKAKEKLPTFYASKEIIYPPSVNLEQTSSERTAQYKSELLKSLNLNDYTQLVDVTGGFGIDTFYFSKLFEKVMYVEPNLNLLEMAKHNHQRLGQFNIEYNNTRVENFLEELQGADVIYIDPSRRNSKAGKVFRLADCEPDITRLQRSIFQKSPLLLIKASPLLDIQQGIRELKSVKKVIVVSVNNECKELLFLCDRNFTGDPFIEALSLEKEKTDFLSFQFFGEKNTCVDFSAPLTYLYEPNTSLLKAGAFKTIANRYNLFKIHLNTHLYTSEQIIPSFPGRVFKVEYLIKPDKKFLKQHFIEMKANIILRNYPLTIHELKKKTGLVEGGEGSEKKYLVVADRIV
jgi:hypothetical protein